MLCNSKFTVFELLAQKIYYLQEFLHIRRRNVSNHQLFKKFNQPLALRLALYKARSFRAQI